LVSWWVGDTLIDVAAGTSPGLLDNGMMIGAVDETAGSATELMATVGYDFAGMLVIWWSDPAVDVPVPDQPTGISPDGVVSTLHPTLGGTYTNHHPDAGRGAVLFTVTDPAGALVTIAATTPTWSGLHNDTTPDWTGLQWGVTYTLRAWSIARFHDEPGWEPLITDLFLEPANASPPVTTTFTPSPVALDGVADSDVVFATETLDVTTQIGAIEAVDYHANGVPIAASEPNDIAWDTTSVDDGPVELTATVTLDDTTTWDTQPVAVLVDNTNTTAIDRVEADHQRGLIDLDTYAEHLVRAALSLPGLPSRYRPPPPVDPSDVEDQSTSATLAALWIYTLDQLDPATVDLINDLVSGEAPGGGLDPPASHHGPPPPDPNCLDPTAVTENFQLEHDLGPLDACLYSSDDGPVNLDIVYRVESPADDPTYDGTGVDPHPSVDDATVPQQVYAHAETIHAAFATFDQAGYDITDWPEPLTVWIRDLDGPNGSACCWWDDQRSIRLNAGSALARTVVHEVFHLVQFHHAVSNNPAGGFPRPDDRNQFMWALESTARYAEAYYAALPGTPLADLPTTISMPIGSNPDWFTPPPQLHVDAALWQAPAFALTAKEPPLANLPFLSEETRRSGRNRWYSGGIFWQYLAERVNDPAADIDIVFDFWDAIADETGSIDYFADILTPRLAPHDVDLTDALRDFWVAIHLLTTTNNAISRFAWQLPSSNPTHWRDEGRGQLGDQLPAGDEGDGFGQDRRRLMAPSRLPIGFNDTPRTVTSPSPSIPTMESGRISPGGAWVYDLEMGDFAPGSLDVTVDTASPHVAATLVAYDSAGHPTICTRSATPEIDQRNSPGALSVDLDHDCTDASLIITHTDPRPDTQPVDVRVAITHTWDGITEVPVNFWDISEYTNGPVTGLPTDNWLRVLRPYIWTLTPLVAAHAIEFTVHAGATDDPSGFLQYRLHFGDQSHLVTAAANSTTTTTVDGGVYPYSTTTTIARVEVVSGEVLSWDAHSVAEFAL
ncbi:MAG: hypothetical protein JJU45_03620, partial [Acidimicrobiia bacterium]|nr:hypothetical protein [Acidimicrobiia bacterium]